MVEDPNALQVIKLNTRREETWRYEGRVIGRGVHSFLIEAFFDREDIVFHGMHLGRHDRFIERYYDNRWYNLFEIHDRDDDHLKGWYCNVTRPAEFTPGEIVYVDLALDLLAFPDGRYLVLDEAEFDSLSLDHQERFNANQALTTLVELAESGQLHDALINKKGGA